MHDSLLLYDASLNLLAQEEEAFDSEDEERLLELGEKRSALMREAWEKRAGCGAQPLLDRLELIRKSQETLTAKARARQETLRLSLQSSRKENSRLAGYGRVVGSGQTALLVR